MRVKSISLRDFRNYSEADISVEKGCVVLVGANGQGKTNLVEAVNFLATLGSHRSQNESALIRTGAVAAIIRVYLVHEDRQILLEAQINSNTLNKAQVNRSPAKLRDFPRYIATVLFAPEDLLLIRGDPGGRRKFLDDLLVTRTPRLQSVLIDYDRAVKQRNTFLKTARRNSVKLSKDSALDIWDERVVVLGSEIMVERRRLVSDLNQPVSVAYQSIAGERHDLRLTMKDGFDVGRGGSTNLEVKTTFHADEAARLEVGEKGAPEFLTIGETRAAFLGALTASRAAELDRGMTLIGPHRHDVEFSLNGLPTKGYASHGETWSYALSLRLGAARLLRAESALGDPILILDDVFAELDESRRAQLALAVGDFEQVFITAAVRDDVPAELLQQVFHVERGTIVSAS